MSIPPKGIFRPPIRPIPKVVTQSPMKVVTRPAFCAKCQKITPHVVSIPKRTQEVILTCESKCGHFIKFHPRITPQEVADFLVVYERVNKNHVQALSDEEIQQRIDAIINAKPAVVIHR